MKNLKIKASLIGFFSGIVSGLFSSGGGLILIPFYNHLFKVSDKETKSNAIFCILPMVITSALIYGINNNINWKITSICATGSIIGSIIGSKLLNSLNPVYLKIIFIIFLIYSGFKISI